MIPSQPLEWDYKVSDVSMAAHELGSLGDIVLGPSADVVPGGRVAMGNSPRRLLT